MMLLIKCITTNTDGVQLISFADLSSYGGIGYLRRALRHLADRLTSKSFPPLTKEC